MGQGQIQRIKVINADITVLTCFSDLLITDYFDFIKCDSQNVVSEKLVKKCSGWVGVYQIIYERTGCGK